MSEARKLANILVEERLAACCSIVPDMLSIYRWRDAVEQAEECLLICKSRTDLFPSLSTRIKAVHSYEVPEIILLPMKDASREYLEWMDQVLAPETGK